MPSYRTDAELLRRALSEGRAATTDYDLDPQFRPGSARPLRPASVLVPIVNRADRSHVILTRRAAKLVHHPGQISFPGGKRDEADKTAQDTALREAREEIGLDAAQVRILGAFEGHETVTHFAITPFVGMVDPGFAARPDPNEVEEVFEVPLDFLLDPANMQIHHRNWQGRTRHYYAIPYGPHYIWGATARMIKALATRLGSL